ncbi:hypothetical protein J2Y69_002410 [Microbacterium resistens]|uniref:Cell division protein FtsL n=1 Tax=Microbacterium resistens TaxID=156977 RepID=A0ABU1SG12_9MICO|nr:hypothetical protein [Microbacterium resistens]MDR6867802.1 hypothetical protein [Microbacterium resistens]
MSLAAEPLLLPTIDEPSRRRRLQAVERPARRRRPKLAYAIMALAGAALIGAIQIGLSIATTQDSFVVAKLTQENRELTWQAQAASEEIAGLSSPQALAVSAANLGLVVGGSANYLRLSDGALIGAGGEASQASTVDPRGAGAVPNALVSDTPKASAGASAAQGVQPKAENIPVVDTNVPPPAEGLPTPSFQ